MREQLYSFDVYDTLITRKTATPEGIFALMQRKLEESETAVKYPKRLVRNFYRIRIQAEKVARNTYIVGETYDITLQQIYECVRLSGGLSEEQTEELMHLEIETELENTLPISENIEKVHSLKEKGERVVLISNMYLKTDVIRRILVRMDSVFQDITMYVSGDIGKTKGTRTLYYYVKEQEKVDFSNWHHYGDNRKLDVEIPAHMGICAEHFRVTDLYDWEKELLSGREDNSELQVMIGVSHRTNKGAQALCPYQVGSGYSAEILLPYVLWVLQESMRKGIQKLYFIARDGYILKKMADIVIEKYDYPIKTCYLYGSRRAWRLPSIKPDEFDLQEFFRWNYPGQIYSYQRFAEILGLTLDELKLFLPFMKDGQSELSRPLVQEIMKILEAQQKQIAELICQKQQKQNHAAVRYLYQEIGEEKDNFAFVDLIGSGYTQRCLADLMDKYYQEPIRTFFYRLDSCKESVKNISHAFFPNRIKMGNVIEILCGAPHGQTCGYECINGSWVPVLGEDEGNQLAAYGFGDYVKGIIDYTKEFAASFPKKPFVLQDLGILELYFDYMAEAKNQKLYDFIADMPYGITGQEKKVTSFAPRMSNRELSQIYFWHKGTHINKFYTGYSLEFSVMRLSGRQKRKLDFYKKHSEDIIVRWLRKHIFQSKTKVCCHRYDLIADRIVLYGAGKRGRLLQKQLTVGRQYHAEIVLWVDKNVQKCKEEGLDVRLPESIRQIDYQQVVIAVADQTMAEEIKGFLRTMGVEEGRMLWIAPDRSIR